MASSSIPPIESDLGAPGDSRSADERARSKNRAGYVGLAVVALLLLVGAFSARTFACNGGGLRNPAEKPPGVMPTQGRP